MYAFLCFHWTHHESLGNVTKYINLELYYRIIGRLSRNQKQNDSRGYFKVNIEKNA